MFQNEMELPGSFETETFLNLLKTSVTQEVFIFKLIVNQQEIINILIIHIPFISFCSLLFVWCE